MGVDQQRRAQWQVTQAMLQGLAQPSSGAGGTPLLTPEQMGQINPEPKPSMFPKLLENPWAGVPLRAVGMLGQTLQILTGARGGGEAPRPVGVKELLEMRRTQSLDAFRKQQAEETTKYRQDTLGERTRHDLVTEGKGAAEKDAKTVQDELLRAGRAKGLVGQALADFVEQGSKEGPERDLDILAREHFPNDPVKQAQWREAERLRRTGEKKRETSLATMNPKIAEQVGTTRETIRMMDELLNAAFTPDGQVRPEMANRLGPVLGRFRGGDPVRGTRGTY